MMNAGRESLSTRISRRYAARAWQAWAGMVMLTLTTVGYAHAAVPKSVRAAHLYAQLGHVKWIAFGHGPKILYDVYDPNCPYCHLLFNELKPLIGPDHLTVRMVTVGYLTATSARKAATILMAKDPRQMVLRGEDHFSRHGMQIPLTIPSRTVRRTLHYNLRLVSAAVGYTIVPVLVYKKNDGQARFVVGQPQLPALKAIIAGVQ